MIISSPILAGDSGAGEGGEVPGVSGSSNDFDFGVDPSLDPELAMVNQSGLVLYGLVC